MQTPRLQSVIVFCLAALAQFSASAQTAAPVITAQPQSATVTLADNVTFWVGVQGLLPAVSSGNLRLWLKADDGVITSTNRVVEWLDQSGTTNHCFQTNIDKQPSLLLNGINGRPALQFDGVQDANLGDYLQGTGDVSLTNGFTSFMVYSKANRTVDEEVPVLIGIPYSYDSVRTFYIRSIAGINNEMSFSAWGNDYGSGFQIPPLTARIWSERLTSTTEIELFDTDGTSIFTNAQPTSWLTSPGSGYYVGGLGAETRNFQGLIAEIIYYQGALNETDRQAVENYLKGKYLESGTAGDLGFQWTFNGTNIVGATNASLTLSNVQPVDAGNYSVVITNSAGSVTSSNALLTVNIPPSINTQPQSQEVVQGADVLLSVSASGAFPLSYQWRFNGNAISNATDSSFSITNAQPIQAGAYSVIVSDGISPVLSSNAILSVDFAPTILTQPQSKTAFSGTNVSFTVTASGYPLNYQWFFNSTNVIAGGTNASLVLTGLTTADAGEYSVQVSNGLGSQLSSNAVLTVINTGSPIFEDFEPGIHAEQWTAFGGTVLATNYGGFVSPTHSLWFGGSGSRFAATRPIDVSGGGVISFQLRLANGFAQYWETVDLPGEGVVLEYSLNGGSWTNIGTYATSNFWNWTLVQQPVPPNAQSAGTLFRWRQLNNSGAPSDHWALDDIQILPASSAPSIFTQPQSRIVPVGTNVTLTVVVTGQSPLTYQWLLNSSNVLTSTNASITLTNVQLGDSGDYSVVVTNSFGSVTSATAVVTVLTPPSISSQPHSQSAVQGTNVSFNVTASGSAPLNYQWRLNGIAISNATDSTFSLTNIQGSDAGAYSVRVSNAIGVVVSSNASLTIDAFPTIANQPQSQSVVAGTNVTFSVTAEAVLPIVLSGNLRLWLKADQDVILSNGHVSEWRDQSTNGNHAFQPNPNKQPLFVSSAVPVSGQPTVRFDGIQDVSLGDWMRGSNSVDIPTGYTSFLVYLRADRTIPEQVPVAVGIPAQQGALRVNFIRNSGEMAFSGWNEDFGTGFNIPADTYRIWTDRLNDAKTLLEFFDVTATNTTLFSQATHGLAAPNAGYYLGGLDAYTRDFQGDISELIVYQGALTDSDRVSVQDYLKTKYFSALGGNGLSYQWQFNGTNIVGATDASLTLTNVQPTEAGNYSVVIANAAGSVSSANAALTVNIPPSISTQPQDQTINAGGLASFSVGTAGTEPFSYQWQKNSNNLAGATNATLVLSAVQTSDAGDYRVIVTSPFGSVTSSNAALSVNITTVRIVSTNSASASSVTVPIQISALGTENAIGFSLSFDPSVLTFSSLDLDSGLAGAILISNTGQLGSGKLGVAVALSSDSTFAAGTQALVQVTFNVGVTTNALGTPVNFTDSPTTRQISDKGAEILPAIFVDGTVAIAAVDYEGDVAPRPNGSRTLTIVDWVQVGRFAAGLDMPTNAGEFQRADCAPRSELGNGAISVTDWVQAGRYATGVDPLTPVGGPSVAADFHEKQIIAAADGVSRTVLLETTNQVGQTHTVSARLIAQGNESAIGFSLAFDPAILTFTGATAGGNAPNAVLNVNTNSLSNGHVGVALSLSLGGNFAAGTQEVIKLTFVAAASATGSTPLTFVDNPVLREVSDTTANSLPTTYSDANMVLTVPGPILTISKIGSSVLLSWPATATNFVLESVSSLGTNWTSITTNLTTNGQSISTSLPVPEQQQFFRLKQP